MPADTVEWGNDRPLPAPLRRITFTMPERVGTAVIGSLAVLGFALSTAGEMLPWQKIATTGTRAPSPEESFGLRTGELRLSELIVWQAPAYYAGLTAILAFIALALLGRATVRRAAAAVALGCTAGQIVLLAGVYGTIKNGSVINGDVSRLRELGMVALTVGTGFKSAFLGVLLLAAAAGIAVWTHVRAHRPDGTPPGPAPAGLTAAVAPVGHGPDEHGPAGHAPAGHAPAGRGPDGHAPAGPAPVGGSTSDAWRRPVEDEPLDLTVAPAAPFERPPAAQ
jgi:hypothetical protein